MNNKSKSVPFVRFALATALGLATIAHLRAQAVAPATPTPAQLAKYDLNKNGRLDPDELAAMAAADAKAGSAVTTTTAAAGTDNDVVALSPFEVKADDDKGYLASSTMSGTRLNSKLEDLGASITVVTKQQLLDTAAVDINDIFLYEANTEGTAQFTNASVNVNGLTTDEIQQSPQTSNRVRGIGAANMSIDGFQSNSRIPVDTYNLESVEISRGANSNLFGLGDASGTVNLNQAQGNLNREATQVTFRTDNLGSFRSTVDINRPIIKNKLAVRVTGLYENKEFVRKPSGDLQRRQYYAVTYRPFAATTIRGSAEFMTDQRQTPNSQTPRDTVSYWLQNGKPTWDPVTFQVRMNGVLGTPIPQASDALLPPGLGLDTTQYTRPTMAFDRGQFLLWAPNRAATTGNNPGGANANSRMIGTYTDIIRSRSTLYPLFTPVSVSNRAIYDWDSVNFSATNWNADKAATYNVSLDQRIFRTPSQQLYFNGAWRNEYSATYNHNVIRETAFLYVDVNERLLDGRANPNFLRPYVTVWDGSNPSRNSDRVDFLRGQLAYELDLTRKNRWVSWLGKQRAVAFYQSQFTTTRSYNTRETIIEPKSWMTAAQAGNLSGLATGHASYKYYLGDNQGFNVEYAPNKQGIQATKYPFHYLADPVTNAYIDDPTLFGETPISTSRNRNELHTRGGNLQSFWLGDRLVTTLGTREDQQRGRSTPGITVHSDGLFYFEDLEARGWNAWTYRSGKTKTYQGVLKAFRGWNFVERRAEEPGVTGWVANTLRSLNLTYNRSDSFRPDATPRKNLLGDLLPDPNGQNRDYGFQVDLYKNKLTARVNWYKTEQKDARVSGGASTAVGRTQQLDTGGSSFALYPWARNVVVSRASMANASEATILTETYKLMQLPNGWFDQFVGYSLSDVNDVTSKGTEFEVNFNPNRSFRLRLTAAKNRTLDSNLSNTTQEYIDWRLPAWTTIKDDAGNLWWTTTTATNWYNNNIIPVLKLARANLGKPRSQIKEWQWSALTNYTFGDERWLGGLGENVTRRLKGLSVGGSIRWMDRSSIGFRGLVDSDGIMRTYDITKPIYDPARTSYDFTASYPLRLFSNKVRASIQINGRDVFSHAGSLRAVTVNPDGTPANFRIVDGPQWFLTTRFDL